MKPPSMSGMEQMYSLPGYRVRMDREGKALRLSEDQVEGRMEARSAPLSFLPRVLNWSMRYCSWGNMVGHLAGSSPVKPLSDRSRVCRLAVVPAIGVPEGHHPLPVYRLASASVLHQPVAPVTGRASPLTVPLARPRLLRDRSRNCTLRMARCLPSQLVGRPPWKLLLDRSTTCRARQAPARFQLGKVPDSSLSARLSTRRRGKEVLSAQPLGRPPVNRLPWRFRLIRRSARRSLPGRLPATWRLARLISSTRPPPHSTCLQGLGKQGLPVGLQVAILDCPKSVIAFRRARRASRSFTRPSVRTWPQARSRTCRLSFSLSKSLKESKTLESAGNGSVGALAGGEDAGVDGDGDVVQRSSWSNMLPELLGEIIQRVEASEDRWPMRRNVVSCACVCKRWRDIAKEIVRSPLRSGKITFPSCLQQPGPRDLPLQCLIKRDKKNGAFYLYLALNPSSFTDTGKFLLAARRSRHGARTEYMISLNAGDHSQGSNAYVGKLSSDFLGTNFTIYDSQPPHSGAKPSNCRASRRFASKQISPEVSAGNFEVGQISYKLNLLKSRGPRRMVCSLKCPQSKETFKMQKSNSIKSSCTILKNKTPRWHEHLQCWCLNFHGRVTVASVKNFQLVATLDQSQPEGKGDEEMVLLQFGKVGDDVFTMDYRQPLSAFQAFAICLTSFGTKLACE